MSPNPFRFLKASNRYPYQSLTGKLWYMHILFLYLMGRKGLKRMSIVPLVKRAYALASDEEFLARCAGATQGFEELWNSRPRESKEDIEHFYQEHDKDVWRQAYLSAWNFEYKRKVLHTYHLIAAERLLPSDPVLDYGGGAGVLAHYLAAKGHRAVDLADIPSRTLDFVRRTMSGLLADVITVDGSEDFGMERYAVIIALGCLEHTLEPLNITRRLIAALRPGGLFIVDFPVETDFTGSHTRQAQEQRPATFTFLKETCEELLPSTLYRKKEA